MKESGEKNMEQNSKIKDRFNDLMQSKIYHEEPVFPKDMLIEVANICNHRCTFCAYTKMKRKKGIISPELVNKILVEAYKLGTREVGLYSGAEPFMCPDLETHIRSAKETGYSYVYISTNGTLCDENRLKKIISEGLDSIKFSINGGDKDTYRKIHGKDDFERISKNVKFVSKYKRQFNNNLHLSISFVECEENKESLKELKNQFEEFVDEIFVSRVSNQMGQMPKYEPVKRENKICTLPFKRFHISREGYLRACCNDYQNALALEDLNQLPLKKAWISKRFKELRHRMISGKIKGTLCHNCLYGLKEKVLPVNTDLAEEEMI